MSLFNFRSYTPSEQRANELAERVKRGETLMEDAPYTEEQIEEWADEAERGYEIEHLLDEPDEA